jgi:outer membrane protein insertion porin family
MLARAARGTPMDPSRLCGVVRLCAAAALCALAACAANPAPGGPFPNLAQYQGKEISGVSVSGDLADVPRDSVVRVLATMPSRCRTLGLLPVCLPLLGKHEEHLLDMQVLGRDVVRIQLVFRDNGYYGTRVVPTVDELPGGKVDVRFNVIPGELVRLRTLAVTGAEHVVPTEELLKKLPLRVGEPFRRNEFLVSVDTVRNALLDAGHPYAQVLRNYQIDTIADVADVTLEAAPGPVVTVDTILFDGLYRVSEKLARHQLTFREGSRVRGRDLSRSQRNLYDLELVRFATVDVAPESLQVTPDSVELDRDSIGSTVLVRLAEAPRYAVDASVGYGTVDCFRGLLQRTDRNFLGGARRLTVTGSVAKVGVGAPLNAGLERSILCKAFRLDSLSSDRVDTAISHALNYRLAADFLQPRLFGTANSVALGAYAEQISELGLYVRRSRGGNVGVVREMGRGTLLSTTYTVERGSTTAHDIFFCVVYEVCQPEEIDVLQHPRWSNNISTGLVRTRVRLDPFPSAGYQFRVGSDLATPFIGSDDRYLRFLGDGSIYRQLRKDWVVQLRLMAGTFLNGVLDSDRGFIPPQKLFYGGGPTTVRGFRRNGLGPVIYVERPSLSDPEESDTVLNATGGRRIVVSTVELTVPSPFMRDRLRLAAFVDGGRVWDPANDDLVDPGFRITPGVGLRVATPVGPIRLDVAYNGYPQPHGPLYLIDTKGDIVGKINTDFVPERSLSLFQRLVLHVSIGQTF